MHSPNLLLVAFVAILTLSTLTFAEPIPFRGGQVAERDAVAEREATAARQEITGAQVLAERQINIEKYCCLDGCGTCNGEVCEISDCYDWPFLVCCAAAFKGKRDENGIEQRYNQRGELMHFITPATVEPPPAPATTELLPKVAERQIFLEERCCDGTCKWCTSTDCEVFACNFPFMYCCATAINGKRNEDGSAQVVNQRGDVVHFVDAPDAIAK